MTDTPRLERSTDNSLVLAMLWEARAHLIARWVSEATTIYSSPSDSEDIGRLFYRKALSCWRDAMMFGLLSSEKRSDVAEAAAKRFLLDSDGCQRSIMRHLEKDGQPPRQYSQEVRKAFIADIVNALGKDPSIEDKEQNVIYAGKTNAETAEHILAWCKDGGDSIFSWATDGCGYHQHIRFVQHRNRAWMGGTPDEFIQFAREYAHSLREQAEAADEVG